MDHMRISGNEPSSVILSQTMWIQKLKVIARNCQNNLKPKGMYKEVQSFDHVHFENSICYYPS